MQTSFCGEGYDMLYGSGAESVFFWWPHHALIASAGWCQGPR